MQKIPLRLARPGMILAQPLNNDDGRVLVGAGVELSDTIINRLETAGVRTIAIKGAPSTGGSMSKRALDRLDHLFRKQTDDPFMIALKAMLRAYFERKIKQESIAET